MKESEAGKDHVLHSTRLHRTCQGSRLKDDSHIGLTSDQSRRPLTIGLRFAHPHSILGLTFTFLQVAPRRCPAFCIIDTRATCLHQSQYMLYIYSRFIHLGRI